MCAPVPRPAPDLSGILAGTDTRLAVYLVRRLQPDATGPDWDDARQTAILAVIVAARTFDPNGGASWKGYACRGAFMALREWRHKRGRVGIRGCPRTRELKRTDDGTTNRVAEIPDRPAPAADLDGPDGWAGELAGKLSGIKDRGRMLLRMRFAEDLTLVEIADRLGITRQAVEQYLRNVMSQLRQVCGAEDPGSRARYRVPCSNQPMRPATA
jgi:RNA polymerase sigma factor (sigma-70 family)